MVPLRSSSSPEWLRRWVNPTAPLPLYRNYSRSQAVGRWPKTCRSLPRYFDSIQCSIRSGTIRASKNSAKRNQSEDRQLLRRIEAAQRLQGGGRLRDCRLAPRTSRDAGFSVFRNSQLGGSSHRLADRDRISDRARDRLGVRTHAGGFKAHGSGGCGAGSTLAAWGMDLRRGYRRLFVDRIVFSRPLHGFEAADRRTASRNRGIPAGEIDPCVAG